MPAGGSNNLGTIYYTVRLDLTELRRELAQIPRMVSGAQPARVSVQGATAAPGATTAATMSSAPIAGNASAAIGGSAASSLLYGFGVPTERDKSIPFVAPGVSLGLYRASKSREFAGVRLYHGLYGLRSSQRAAAREAYEMWRADPEGGLGFGIAAQYYAGRAYDTERRIKEAQAREAAKQQRAALAEQARIDRLDLRERSQRLAARSAYKSAIEGSMGWIGLEAERSGETRAAVAGRVVTRVRERAASIQKDESVDAATALARATRIVVRELKAAAKEMEATAAAAAKTASANARSARRVAEYEVGGMGPFRQFLAYRGMARDALNPEDAARYRALAKRAWRNSNVGRFFGPPSGMGLYFSAVFGGWEVAQSATALMQSSLAVGNAKSASEALGAMAGGIEAATQGPLGAMSSIGSYILGLPSSPIAVSQVLRRAEAREAAFSDWYRGVFDIRAARRANALVGSGGGAARAIREANAAAMAARDKRAVEMRELQGAISVQGAELSGLASEIERYREGTEGVSGWIPGLGLVRGYQWRVAYDRYESVRGGMEDNKRKLKQMQEADAVAREGERRRITEMRRERSANIRYIAEMGALSGRDTFAGDRARAAAKYKLDIATGDFGVATTEYAATLAGIGADQKKYNRAGNLMLQYALAGDIRNPILAAKRMGELGVQKAITESRIGGMKGALFDPTVWAARTQARSGVRAAEEYMADYEAAGRYRYDMAVLASRPGGNTIEAAKRTAQFMLDEATKKSLRTGLFPMYDQNVRAAAQEGKNIIEEAQRLFASRMVAFFDADRKIRQKGDEARQDYFNAFRATSVDLQNIMIGGKGAESPTVVLKRIEDAIRQAIRELRQSIQN